MDVCVTAVIFGFLPFSLSGRLTLVLFVGCLSFSNSMITIMILHKTTTTIQPNACFFSFSLHNSLTPPTPSLILTLLSMRTFVCVRYSAYALVLSGNHVYTSGAGGTHAATIRGALRAEREDLLTVVLPQSMAKQPKESQELLKKVKDVVAMPHNDDKGLDVASRICNSYLLSQTDQLISFAFHESNTVIEANKEAKKLDMLVTTLYLD
jgi:hypothetical protein